MTVTIRRARTSDVRAIRDLVAPLAERRVLVSKDTVAYFEGLQEFRVAETADGELIGCGALHVLWSDLGEVRTVTDLLDDLAEEMQGLQQVCADATGQPVERIAADTERDFWLNTQEALDYGLLGRVIRSVDDLK